MPDLSLTSRIISNYILWRFIRYRLNNLDRRFREATHEMYKRLYGREAPPPRSGAKMLESRLETLLRGRNIVLRDYGHYGRWPPLPPSLSSSNQSFRSLHPFIHEKFPNFNPIFRDSGYPSSKSLAGQFEVFPSV